MIKTYKLPCLDQINCKSSDARVIYEEGDSRCFSCGSYFNKTQTEAGVMEPIRHHMETKKKLSVEDIKTELPVKGFIDRKIKKVVCEFFEVKSEYDANGDIEAHYYPYSNGGYKCRRLPKQFTWVGNPNGLFGRDKFNGGGKRLVITEGELDALSVAQANHDKYSKFYPVISIPSAAAVGELLEHRDWIRSFNEVVLALDDDKAGKEATEKAIRIIGIDKVKIWKPPLKDASEILTKKGSDALIQAIWDATEWCPAGIISKEDIWKQIVERSKIPSVPYPPCLEGLNKKIKGKRLGEIALFISGTGCGKSTVIRECILSDIKTTNEKIGVISLEETPGETGLKLAGMALSKNPAQQEIPEDELKVGFDEVFKDDRVIVLDHQGSIKDDSIVSQLEYMCLIGCKYLYIDHITILVSEGAEGLTGNEAIDKIMNDLLRVAKRHNAWIGLVSHLRKVQTGGKSFEEGKLPTMDDIRGSGSIKQVSFDIIAFARNTMAENEDARNTVQMAVLKSRTTGQTGPVLGTRYNNMSGRLSAITEEEFSVL